MKIGWFSTDWAFERVRDPLAELKSGRESFVPHARQAYYGGTFYYRMAMPAMELAKHGYECVLSWAVQSADDGHLRVQGTDGAWHEDCDVVVFQRWMGDEGVDMALKARAAGQLVVNDIDDHFWALPDSNMAAKTTDPKRSPKFNRDHYRKMLAASSLITCSTRQLADDLAKLGAPITICRNAVDTEWLRPHDPGENGMVGWVGGVPWRDGDLRQLRGVLGPFLEQHGLPFYHGGHSTEPGYATAWDQLGLDPKRVRIAYQPIVKLQQYPHLWEPVGLALVPLADTKFNRAKSWLKGLEASACGLPFIASRLPEYELLGCGRLASHRKEWLAHLEALMDPDARRAEGAANRARALELSIANQWHQWDDAFRAVLPALESERGAQCIRAL